MSLNEILNEHGIKMKNEDGSIRNAVDLIEDFYLKVSADEYQEICEKILAAELFSPVFDSARKRKYKE